MKKSFVLFVLMAVLVCSLLSLSTSASPQKGQSYEVALLIDVSGSMNHADPQRVSIQAAKDFAYNRPMLREDSFKISVILYNTSVITAVSSADVSTEAGMSEYQSCLDTIGKLGKGGKFRNFTCWTKDTDIGAAIVEGKKILDNSTADKKAMVLFTDGKIDLDNNFSVTTPDEKRSEKDSFDCADSFATQGVPMYTVGLNYNNGVDKNFMKKLAETTGGEFKLCTTADEVMGLFHDIFAYLVGGTSSDDTIIDTEANVESKHSVNIYGQAISEANVILSSNSVIKTYKVTNPHGVVVAEKKEDGKVSSSNGCIVNQGDYSVNVKLLHPTDGAWTFSFTSATDGTVRVSEIYLYNLRVEDDSKSVVSVGDTVDFSPTLFNEDTNSRITTKAIYETSVCTIAVSRNGINDVYNAELNSVKNGYKFSHSFDVPGEYEITYRIVNDQFSVETTKQLTVLPPKMVLSATTPSVGCNEEIKIVCQLQNALTNQPIELPDYYAGFTLTADITLDGKKIASIPVDYTAGKEISFTYTPDTAGNYQISATLSRYTDTIVSENTANFSVWQPKLFLSTTTKNIQRNETVTIVGQMQNPLTSQPLAFPDYLADFTLTVDVTLNGQKIDSTPMDFTPGKEISFTYTPEVAGDYQISATLSHYDEVIASENTADFSVWQPKLVLSTGSKNVQRNDKVTIAAQLQNPLTSQPLAVPDYLADFILTVEVTFNGTVISSDSVEYTVGDKINFSYTPTQAGDYKITATISSQGTRIVSENTVEFSVWKPALSISTDKESPKLDDKLTFLLKLLNPETSAEIPVSSYLVGATVEVEIKLDGKSVAKLPVTVNADTTTISVPYTVEKIGKYTITVSVENDSVTIGKDISFTVASSSISMTQDLDDITHSTLKGEYEHKIELDDFFKDSDGDDLKFEATTDNEQITVDVDSDSNTLIITAPAGASGEITVKATDSRGAEYTYTFHMEVKSGWSGIIIGIIVVIVVAILVVVVILVLRRMSIIRKPFRIKISRDGYVAIYEVDRCSSKKNATPAMTLKKLKDKDIDLLNYISQQGRYPLDKSTADSIIDQIGDQLIVKGSPFSYERICIQQVGGMKQVLTKITTCSFVLNQQDGSKTRTVTITFGNILDF